MAITKLWYLPLEERLSHHRARVAAELWRLHSEMTPIYKTVRERNHGARCYLQMWRRSEGILTRWTLKPTVENLRAYARELKAYGKSPLPRTPHSGNDSYTHCGLDDAAGDAREEALMESREYFAAAKRVERRQNRRP